MGMANEMLAVGLSAVNELVGISGGKAIILKKRWLVLPVEVIIGFEHKASLPLNDDDSELLTICLIGTGTLADLAKLEDLGGRIRAAVYQSGHAH